MAELAQQHADGMKKWADCVKAARAHADQNYINFRTMRAPPQGYLCRLPLVLNAQRLLKLSWLDGLPEHPQGLPDAEASIPAWSWGAETASMIRIMGWAE